MERAISFSKGCYIGQEIVERVRSRGQVNRQLIQLRIPGETVPAARTKLFAGDRDVGEITSAAYSPAAQEVVALGYVRAQTLQPGATYSVEGGGLARLTEPRSS